MTLAEQILEFLVLGYGLLQQLQEREGITAEELERRHRAAMNRLDNACGEAIERLRKAAGR